MVESNTNWQNDSVTVNLKDPEAERLERLREESASFQQRQLDALIDLIKEARASKTKTNDSPLKAITDELWGD